MDQLTDFFKLLSDETRLRIMILLAREELCVCELCGILELSQPKVSKHLAKIRDKGMVKDSRKEQFVYYSLNIENETIAELIRNIVENIAEYPLLKKDNLRLADKERYSNRCNIPEFKNK